MTKLSGPMAVYSGTNTPNTNRIDLCPVRPTSDYSYVTSLRLQGTTNAANANIVTLTNASFAQASTITIPDPGSSAAFMSLSKSSSVANAPDTITRVLTCGQAALASAGKVVVQAHTSATSQFAIVDVKVLYSAAGLSGGSGDRLLKLTDGTLALNNAGITAAVLGTPVNTVWGGTGNPLPSTVDPSATTAGADIYLQYSGGTLDYSAGSVKIMVTLAQVTA